MQLCYLKITFEINVDCKPFFANVDFFVGGRTVHAFIEKNRHMRFRYRKENIDKFVMLVIIPSKE